MMTMTMSILQASRTIRDMRRPRLDGTPHSGAGDHPWAFEMRHDHIDRVLKREGGDSMQFQGNRGGVRDSLSLRLVNRLMCYWKRSWELRSHPEAWCIVVRS